MITRNELIKKYFEFFQAKGHKLIPSASLIPSNDPTVLFTTAGMHPLVPFLLGQKHPLGNRIVGIQKCIRTTDIDYVGDASHHTFFEMLGNWSFGDYWKEDAIKYSYEFLTSKKWLEFNKNNLAISFFSGDKDKNVPADMESKEIWKSLKIPEKRIIPLKEDNWWGPAGETGPCGPDTEMFYWAGKGKSPKEFNPNESTLATDGKEWVEIWNDVFMQYNKTKEGKFFPLKQKNVDTGMGIERTLTILNKLKDNYETEVWQPIIKKIEQLSGKKYKGNEKTMRIIADHIKASVFIISDGILPSNTGRGYVLRRLIRRAMGEGRKLGLDNFIEKIAESVFQIYKDYNLNKKEIKSELKKEEERFNKTLPSGLKLVDKFSINKKISGKDAFLLYQSYGLPIEMTIERAGERGSDVDLKGFNQELKKHQELSRTASAGVFKSGLADHSEKTTRLHTATHLLLAALRQILMNENILQKGSNITSERLRLDFSFPRKLTNEEIKKIEDLVNAQIQKSCEVIREEMSPKDAKKKGALGVFGEKYGEIVSVYTMGDFSKEICAGPHVKNTCELGHFKIIKEESSSAGVRRIKAVLE